MKRSDVGGANRGAAEREKGRKGEGWLSTSGVLVSWSDISCHAAHWTGHQDIHTEGNRCKGSTVHLSMVDGRHWKLATFMYRKV